MISTRQLFFIISIVFFSVKHAISGQSSSSTKASPGSAENVKVVNKEHLNYCILELTTAFQKQENAFDNLLYAFINLDKADFEQKIYTEAAYDYFYDLLNTAHDIIIQPVLVNPRNYCKNHYGFRVENCIRNIAELECEADDDAIFCVKNLYLNWKKRNMSNLIPMYGTENISDEDLATAISRGTDKFPGLSNEDLLKRIADLRLLKDFYAKNKDRYKNIEHLFNMREYYTRIERDSAAENSSRQFDGDDRSRQFTGDEDQAPSHIYDKKYSTQVLIDLKEVRYECYGIEHKDYKSLLIEYNRRQKIYKNHYAMYLYNQVEYWGQTQLDSEEKNKFQDPENFCTNYLLNNARYYDYLDY